MGQRVADELVPFPGEEQHGLGLAQQRHIDRPLLRPRLGVAHVGRQLGHRRGVGVVDGDPQRLERVDVRDRAPDDPQSQPVCLNLRYSTAQTISTTAMTVG
jgi:hypothetical protein